MTARPDSGDVSAPAGDRQADRDDRAGMLALDRAARRVETPCGAGRMVWRVWGEGPALVLLHGGYGSWLHWLRNIPALSRYFRVFAADLPGLGESDLAPEPGDPEAIAAVVAHGLDALGLAPATTDLVGFSFGALVGAKVGALRPGFRSFVMVGAGALGTVRRPITLERTDGDVAPADLRAAHRRNLARLMIADPARIDDLAIDIQLDNVARARVKSRRFAASTGTLDVLDAARPGRLHAIWGEHDQVAAGGFEEREARLRAVRPDVAVHLVPDAGHWVAWEQADRFDDLLLAILDPAAR